MACGQWPIRGTPALARSEVLTGLGGGQRDVGVPNAPDTTSYRADLWYRGVANVLLLMLLSLSPLLPFTYST